MTVVHSECDSKDLSRSKKRTVAEKLSTLSSVLWNERYLTNSQKDVTYGVENAKPQERVLPDAKEEA